MLIQNKILLLIFSVLWVSINSFSQNEDTLKHYGGEAKCGYENYSEYVMLSCELKQKVKKKTIIHNDFDNSIITIEGEVKLINKKWYLWNGKHYVYDEFGLLETIEIYTKGLCKKNDPKKE